MLKNQALFTGSKNRKLLPSIQAKTGACFWSLNLSRKGLQEKCLLCLYMWDSGIFAVFLKGVALLTMTFSCSKNLNSCRLTLV